MSSGSLSVIYPNDYSFFSPKANLIVSEGRGGKNIGGLVLIAGMTFSLKKYVD